MGITDDCTPASFITVTAPPPVLAYQQPLDVLEENGQPSGLEATVVEETMVEVVVPDSRSVYWRDPSFLGDSNQLHLYGGTVLFNVQWESNAASITSSTLSSTNAIVIGRHNTALRFRVAVESEIEDSSATLAVELSAENVVAVNNTEGTPTRKLMLLTLSEVRFLLLPASFQAQSHTSRLFIFTHIFVYIHVVLPIITVC